MKTDQKIGIVGANSQVGTELTLILDEQGVDVIPIVRNKLGATVFDRCDIDYRIGEITNAEDARSLMIDLDVVVILSHVTWFYGELPQKARKTNEKIIKNTVDYSPDQSNILFFSSLVAYGSKIGLSDHSWYGKEKKHLEKVLSKICNNKNKEYNILRLGHVYGPTQDHTIELSQDIEGKSKLVIPIQPEKLSNVVHTNTLSEIIKKVTSPTYNKRVTPAVNSPQWSWEKVLNYYNPKLELEKSPNDRDRSSLTKQGLKKVMNKLEPYQDSLVSILHRVPDKYNSRILNIQLSNMASSSIDTYRGRITYDHRHFGYDPVPNNQVNVDCEWDLSKTEDMIKEKLEI